MDSQPLPVLILQHDAAQRPGYLLERLHQRRMPARILHPAQGEALPHSLRGFSCLVLLGSDHSVNDAQPWIERERQLVRTAIADDVPVLGHCFGGQMMAAALGARVGRAAQPQIGFARLRATPAGQAVIGAPELVAFNWHHETFGIPAGATRTLVGTHCLNKGFIAGRHLAFQCHLEVTADILIDWCAHGADELARAHGPAVQTAEQILALAPRLLPAVHRAARQVYDHWIDGLPGARAARVQPLHPWTAALQRAGAAPAMRVPQRLA